MSDERDSSSYALYYFGFSANLGYPILYLEDLYVKPEWRRQKIATTLLQKLAGLALQRECIRLEWHVFSWNEEARAFYDAFGGKAKHDLIQMRLGRDALSELTRRM